MNSFASLPSFSRRAKGMLLKVQTAEEFLVAVNCSVLAGQGLVSHFRENSVDALAFFSPGGTLSRIVKLAYALPKLIREVPLLKRGSDAMLILSQLQAASLLCNSFLCLYPNASHGCGGMNMNAIFETKNREKLKCILHYLGRVTENDYTGQGLIRFHRRCLKSLPLWESCSDALFFDKDSVEVSARGKIEDTPTDRYFHSDFANKVLGGGVLGHGLVQEEIRFLICPELIVGRLFCEEMLDNEVIVIQGFERFSNYSGYGYEGFAWKGNYNDVAEFAGSFRNSTLIAFDAQSYKKSSINAQYAQAAFCREMNKAYCAFFREDVEDESVVATGNWGAGVFLGNAHLKFLVQCMAAAVAERKLLFLTWEDEVLADELTRLKNALTALRFTVGEMYKALSSYNPEGTESLFNHVMNRATGSQ